MHDPGRVRLGQGIGHGRGDGERVGHRQLRFPGEAGAQRFPAHEGHHVVQQPVGGAAVEQAEDVGMLQPRGGADFAQEAVAAERCPEVGVQDLDGDGAVVLAVMGTEDGRHAAGADLAEDVVAVGDRRGESRGNIGHFRGKMHGWARVRHARRQP